MPVSICGDAPSRDPDLVRKLIEFGLTSISVSADAFEVTRAAPEVHRLYFPAFLSTVDSVFQDNTMARALPLGTNVLTLGRFRYADDYFDFYFRST